MGVGWRYRVLPPSTRPLERSHLSVPAAKGRAISLPMDLDAHISVLLSSGASCMLAAQRNAANYKATTRTFPRVTPMANQWDYKNIIEKLQVGRMCPGWPCCAAHSPRGSGHQTRAARELDETKYCKGTGVLFLFFSWF